MQKKNIFEDISITLKAMKKEISKNGRDKNNRGFPIAAIIYDELNILASASNDKTPKRYKYKTHAEMLCISQLNNIEIIPKKLRIMISIPPCHECLRKIKEIRTIKEIIYLTDPKNRTEEPYIQNETQININIYQFKSEAEEALIKNLGKKIEHAHKREKYNLIK